MITFIPGGARGVLLKSKGPNKYACADNFGLTLAVRNKFKVSSDWTKSLSHSTIGKLQSQVAKPAIRWFLKVHIPRSDALRRCILGVVSSYSFICF